MAQHRHSLTVLAPWLAHVSWVAMLATLGAMVLTHTLDLEVRRGGRPFACPQERATVSRLVHHQRHREKGQPVRALAIRVALDMALVKTCRGGAEGRVIGSDPACKTPIAGLTLQGKPGAQGAH